VDGKIEKSPFQRVPLSAMSENRSALLSGVQRVLVKPKDATPVAQQLRSPNNFMKPTESSRYDACVLLPPVTDLPGHCEGLLPNIYVCLQPYTNMVHIPLITE